MNQKTKTRQRKARQERDLRLATRLGLPDSGRYWSIFRSGTWQPDHFWQTVRSFLAFAQARRRPQSSARQWAHETQALLASAR